MYSHGIFAVLSLSLFSFTTTLATPLTSQNQNLFSLATPQHLSVENYVGEQLETREVPSTLAQLGQPPHGCKLIRGSGLQSGDVSGGKNCEDYFREKYELQHYTSGSPALAAGFMPHTKTDKSSPQSQKGKTTAKSKNTSGPSKAASDVSHKKQSPTKSKSAGTRKAPTTEKASTRKSASTKKAPTMKKASTRKSPTEKSSRRATAKKTTAKKQKKDAARKAAAEKKNAVKNSVQKQSSKKKASRPVKKGSNSQKHTKATGIKSGTGKTRTKKQGSHPRPRPNDKGHARKPKTNKQRKAEQLRTKSKSPRRGSRQTPENKSGNKAGKSTKHRKGHKSHQKESPNSKKVADRKHKAGSSARNGRTAGKDGKGSGKKHNLNGKPKSGSSQEKGNKSKEQNNKKFAATILGLTEEVFLAQKHQKGKSGSNPGSEHKKTKSRPSSKSTKGGQKSTTKKNGKKSKSEIKKTERKPKAIALGGSKPTGHSKKNGFKNPLMLGKLLGHGPVKLPHASEPKKPSKAPPAAKPSPASDPPIAIQTGESYEEQARRANQNRVLTPADISQLDCTQWQDCPCPKGEGHSTSCINGKCSCDNAVIDTFAKFTVKAMVAMGQSKILEIVSGVFKTFATIEQILPEIARLFGPEARAAVKGAVKAMPDVGDSWIDAASEKAGSSIWEYAKNSPV